MRTKVYNVNDYCGTEELFLGRGWELVNTIDEADIVCLNGGEDIATEIYGEKPIDNWIPERRSRRDVFEERVYNIALEKDKFILGICRGAQLMNVFNGGSMWQHVSNHNTSHFMYDLFLKEDVFTTSVHHQMMIPGPDATIIAVSHQATIKQKQDETLRQEIAKRAKEDGQDPEVIWYPKTRSLCIQGHPEFAPTTNFAGYCFKLINSLRTDGVWPPKTASVVAAGGVNH